MSLLIQKHLGSLSSYRIEKDRVAIIKKTFTKQEEFSVKFENLGFEINRKKTSLVLWFIPLHLVFAALNVYVAINEYNLGAGPKTFVYVAGALLFTGIAIYSFFEKNDKVYMAGGGQNLDLDASIPSRETVDSFITDLHQAMRLYYKEKFGDINPILDKDQQVHKFKWLVEINAISNTEYELLVEKLRIQDLLN